MLTNFVMSPSVVLSKALKVSRFVGSWGLPIDHFCSLVDVGDAVEEAFDSGEAFSEGSLGVVSIVQVLSHIYNYYIPFNFR